MTAQTSLVMWIPMGIEDPRGAALADRHYSRQTIGAKGYAPPGKRFALHYRDVGEAVWVVVYNRDITGAWRWRNTLFRNETHTLSSTLIVAATSATYQRWRQRYGETPPKMLTTEIDIEATRARRGKRNEPGHCYLIAGWRKVRDIAKGHGRPAKVELVAPLERVGFASTPDRAAKLEPTELATPECMITGAKESRAAPASVAVVARVEPPLRSR